MKKSNEAHKLSKEQLNNESEPILENYNAEILFEQNVLSYDEIIELGSLEDCYLLSDLKKTIPGDENYCKVYCIFYGGNCFYYSKEMDDLFKPIWDESTDDGLSGGKTMQWYYYFIDSNIAEKFQIDEENGIKVTMFKNPYKTMD